jgi:hypothetical protein
MSDAGAGYRYCQGLGVGNRYCQGLGVGNETVSCTRKSTVAKGFDAFGCRKCSFFFHIVKEEHFLKKYSKNLARFKNYL